MAAKLGNGTDEADLRIGPGRLRQASAIMPPARPATAARRGQARQKIRDKPLALPAALGQ
jgi:hypothetical protein